MSDSIVVSRATTSHASHIADVMGKAFMNDPVSCWIFADPADRERLNAPFFRVFVDRVLSEGTVLTSADMAAVTLWLDVDPAHDEPEPDLGSVIKEAIGPYAARFAVLDQLMTANHPTTGPHAYLPFIAVHPDRQGQGLGGALLRARLAELDADNRPAYLEASSPRNAALYARLGFRHFGSTIDLPDGPSLYPMWRPAQGDQSRTKSTAGFWRRPLRWRRR